MAPLVSSATPWLFDGTVGRIVRDPLLDACQLADIADRVSIDWFRSSDRAAVDSLGHRFKAADKAVEVALRDEVRRIRPLDAIIGQELGETVNGESAWVIDPIDGTAAFRAGRPEWASLIAFQVAGSIQAAVCSAPALGLRWQACLGNGAIVGHLGDRSAPPAVVVASSANRLERARVGYWVAPPSADTAAAGAVTELMQNFEPVHPAGVRPSWGRGYPNGSLLVAGDVLDAFILVGGGSWDHAAPSLIVEEAGGRCGELHRDGILALVVTAAKLFDETVSRLKQEGFQAR